MRARELVGWNLRRLRVAAGVSQDRLGFDAGVDRAYVGAIERGEMNPSVEVLERLAETLSSPLIEFFVVPASDAVPPQPLKGGRPRP